MRRGLCDLSSAESHEWHPWGSLRFCRLCMLLDIQNRGQLAAGMTTYYLSRDQLIDTHKDVGTVSELRLCIPKCESLMQEYAGLAAIGHVRYATCGRDDRGHAQPFERHNDIYGSTSGSVSHSTASWPITRNCATGREMATIIWPARTTPRSSCTRSVRELSLT